MTRPLREIRGTLAEIAWQGESARQEMILLGCAALFVGLSALGLILALPQRSGIGPAIAAWLVGSAALHILLNRVIPDRDPFLLPIALLLSGWGLVLIARLAPPFLARQVIWLLVSEVIVAVIMFLPPDLRWLRRYRYTWLLLGLLLLGATILLGVNPSGYSYAPRLWLDFGVIFLQPSEILKLLLVAFLASYLADKSEILISTHTRILRWELPSLPYLAPLLVMWGFCIILLTWQRDLGAASLFFVIFLMMLYVSTEQIGYLAVGGLLLTLAGCFGYFLYDVVRLRVDTWWNPWPEADDRAFQVVQSLIAVASGGILGAGIGLGSPTFVPVVHSDFVFAAVAEEWGLIGALAVVACFSILVMRAFQIALRNIDQPFRALLAAGIGISIGAQSLLIMGGVLKLVPLTGVTLPFLSYGGSSLLSSFVMIALLLRLSAPIQPPVGTTMLIPRPQDRDLSL
jgi:cell division protein FtsW (lipid II flippase)